MDEVSVQKRGAEAVRRRPHKLLPLIQNLRMEDIVASVAVVAVAAAIPRRQAAINRVRLRPKGKSKQDRKMDQSLIDSKL